MDGYVVIGTELDTKEFDNDLSKLKTELDRKKVELEIKVKNARATESQLNSYKAKLKSIDEELDLISKDAQRAAELEFKMGNKPMEETLNKQEIAEWMAIPTNIKAQEEELISLREKELANIDKANAKLLQQNLKIEEAKQKIKEIESNSIKKQIDNIGNSVSKVIKKVAKWSLAILGIRSVYLGIRSAMATLTQYDKQLESNVNYLKWALANSLKPVIEWIVKAMYEILYVIGKIIYSITGINIFKKSGIDEYSKAMKSSSKSAKELKKTLAGFDEMNVLNSNKDTSAGGGGSPLPDLGDLSNYESKIEKITQKLVDDWFNVGEEMRKALKNPQAFDEAYGEWSVFMQGLTQFFLGIWDVITGITEVIGGILDIIVGLFTGNFEKIKSGWKFLCDGIWNILRGLLEIIVGLIERVLGLINGLVVSTWKGILGIIETVKNVVYDYIIKPVGDMFSSMWEGITNGAKKTWEGIKKIFSKVANFFGEIFSKAWTKVKEVFSTGGVIFKGITTGILEAFKRIVNVIIEGINNIVAIPFNGINSAFNNLRDVDLWGWKPFEWVPEIKVPQIPKLAKGGIINNPGRGVPLGSAIGGERGAEGVIPLTDNQQMELLGEAIGRYISVNLTNITELDGRVIARKIDKVRQNDNFVMNR